MPLAPRLLALGLLLAVSTSAQPTFVTTVGGPDDDVPTSVALAPDGTVYVAGAFERTVDFDPADPNDAEDTFTRATPPTGTSPATPPTAPSAGRSR